MIYIKDLERWKKWFVRIESTIREPKEGIFWGYDGPSYNDVDDEIEEDELLLRIKSADGGYYLLVYGDGDITKFTPIRKATKEEMS
ncbi:hypothetical protein ACFOPX_07865 [Helicobacter baculiformis]|uniref:Uncharacterized protein n=1 Tax=Helicobacter baculiformis TaxID=427351 RepID=A0ABV7ZJG6_9HELI|nr:hypothetical protein [Helicobacter baculiformis]